MKLVGSMIVRDEADRYQPYLAQQMLSYCDELRILDDGSKDGTGELLRDLGPEVRVIRNRHSRWDADGEGHARQQLLMWTLASDADYVIQLDADEMVPEGQKLRRMIGPSSRQVYDPRRFNEDAIVWSLRMTEVWTRGIGAWGVRVDGEWGPRPSPLCWQAPPSNMDVSQARQLGWSIPERKLACGREPEIVRYLDARDSGVDVLHLGWSDPAERRSRYERYMRIDGGEHHASAHLRSIMEPPTLTPYPVPAGF